MHVGRTTHKTQIIVANNNTYQVQGPCRVSVNSAGLHTSPSVWGHDSLTFKPTRWLTPDSRLGSTKLITPDRGTFIPWSGGPRVCPGQKMSEVEFIAVMVTIFAACDVEPVTQGTETIDQARKRLTQLMQDSQPRLTLQMNRPEGVKLRWLRRHRGPTKT